MSNIMARVKRLFVLRFAVLYPLGIYVLLFAIPGDQSTWTGLAFMLAGMIMRLWSNGYAIKMGKLTTAGPYAFVRNPLYIGTALIIIGFIVMLQIFVAGVAFFAVLAIVYTRTIRQEQQRLSEVFGKDYQDYCHKVPAMWPTLKGYAAGEKWPFSWQRLWESREHKVFLWVSIMVILFHVKKEFVVPGAHGAGQSMFLIGTAGSLGLLDLVGEYIRHHQKKV